MASSFSMSFGRMHILHIFKVKLSFSDDVNYKSFQMFKYACDAKYDGAAIEHSACSRLRLLGLKVKNEV